MRTVSMSAALVVALSSPAFADDDRIVAIDAFVAAIEVANDVQLRDALAGSVKIANLEFADSSKCKREFRGRKTIARRKRVRLARCLLALRVRPTRTSSFVHESDRSRAHLGSSDGDVEMTLRFARARDKSLRVSAIEMVEILQPAAGFERGEGTGAMGDGTLIPSVVAAPPPPPPPQNITPTLLEAQRIAGNREILPDGDTRTTMSADGSPKVVGVFKLCVATSGAVSSVTRLKSTTYPDYDAKIIREMKTWRYRPFLVNGRSTPACTAITFIYVQMPPTTAP